MDPLFSPISDSLRAFGCQVYLLLSEDVELFTGAPWTYDSPIYLLGISTPRSRDSQSATFGV